MNIHTVAENLRNTIAGKEGYLKAINDARKMYDSRRVPLRAAADNATAKFLEVNIDELRAILKDVEACCEKATADSWAGSVDRQGGAFDESELRGRDGWL